MYCRRIFLFIFGYRLKNKYTEIMKKTIFTLIVFGALTFANAAAKNEVKLPVKELCQIHAVSTNAP